MKQKPIELRLCKQLASLTGTNADDWFLVYKARLGIELVLQILAKQRGKGEVITQPYTCITAVNPILAAGHVPVYADINPDDFSLNPDGLQASASTRAIIMQHTFGIESSSAKTVRDFADEHRLLLIEDSAHLLGQMSKRSGNFLADISVHSFGVEKMLPTKFGGAVWVNPELSDEALRFELINAFQQLPLASRSVNRRARSYASTNRVLNRLPGSMNARLRTTLAKMKLFEAAILPKELSGSNCGLVSRPRSWMIKKVLEGLENYDKQIKNRTTISDFYRVSFLNHEKLVLPKGCQAEGPLLRLPLLYPTPEAAEQAFHDLQKSGFFVGKWYRPTLFPGPSDPNIYNYDRELCPVSEDLSTRIINLPTNISLTRARELVDVING